MTPLLADMPPLRTALLCAAPLSYLLAALVATMAAATPQAPETPQTPRTAWRLARWGAALAGIAAVMSLAWMWLAGAGLARPMALLNWGDTLGLRFSVRSDALGVTMLLLVSFIGWIITGYSQPYLEGEPGQRRYLRNLMFTLAAVTTLVTTNNLLVLAGAWVVTSLSLHGLLTFFHTRPQALIAAHKKFIASRVADLCLLGGIALLANALGTLEIDQAIAAARALPAPGAALQAAAVLLACSALLKCAQLPVHGWLIQVMEAPTPVSALLHAGVVNLGGFLLIRLGSLVGDIPAAQALLVVIGSITAVVAALVMMTRISVKVSLAWSTCAQMGFMLMQCGLGLYDLALLHLVAHSLYKAHAFLSAGGAVEQNRLRQMTPPSPALSFAGWLLSATVGMAVVGSASWVWGFSPAEAPALWAFGGILSLALAPLVAGSLSGRGGLWSLAGVGGAFAVALAYFGLHALFGRSLGADGIGAAPGPALVAWVLACFGLLFIFQGAVRARPNGTLARRLYPALFAGLYLDELFTRLTFRLWPAGAPATPGALAPAPAAMVEASRPGAL